MGMRRVLVALTEHDSSDHACNTWIAREEDAALRNSTEAIGLYGMVQEALGVGLRDARADGECP